MRRLILISLLASNAYAQDKKDISYNFLEIGYGYIDLARDQAPDGFYLDGAFDLSEHFYIGGLVDNRETRTSDFNRYNISFGFHTNGDSNTDFYTNLTFGKLQTGTLRDGRTAGIFAGTRTAFNEKFELISRLGFSNVENINHDDGDNIIVYEAEVKGLFKFSKNQAIIGALESYDSDFGAKVGYRYSF